MTERKQAMRMFPHQASRGRRWLPSRRFRGWLAGWSQDRRRILFVAAPVISGNDANNTVTITCATIGAVIYYTTNNTRPTRASALYSGPFVLADGTFTVRAVAFTAAGMESVETLSMVVFTSALPAITLTSMNIVSSTPVGGGNYHHTGSLNWTYNLNGYPDAVITVEYAVNLAPWTALAASEMVTAGALNWATVNMGGPYLFGLTIRWRAKHPSGDWSNTLTGQLGNPE